MVTNHVYNKKHNTTEINIDLAATKLPANSSHASQSVSVCLCAGHATIYIQEYEANHYINKP